MAHHIIEKTTFFKSLTSLSYVEKIILYNVQTHGDYQGKTDIDLAIDCPTANDRDWHVIETIAQGAEKPLKVDVIRYDKLAKDDPLHEIISQEGIILYFKHA